MGMLPRIFLAAGVDSLHRKRRAPNVLCSKNPIKGFAQEFN
jgi:hypothetical protein